MGGKVQWLSKREDSNKSRCAAEIPEAAHRAGMKSIGISTVNSIEEILTLNGVVEAKEDFAELKPDELIIRHLQKAERAGL